MTAVSSRISSHPVANDPNQSDGSGNGAASMTRRQSFATPAMMRRPRSAASCVIFFSSTALG
ncbi:hypothetical protein SB4_07090 [Sphingomonas sanguinis]|uniref:Uncharacterized protein n=1 Tax=Sphingomonas sanguinis TaxID=33051 RepID=A0A147IY39_9SPHN|nr:hypothetical protein SB4_07090 [Sphingomonas sanguinis]